MSENTEHYEEINSNLEPLWTVKQVADYFHLKEVTIYRWISTKRIKSVHISNRVRIPRSEVERIAGEIHSKLTP